MWLVVLLKLCLASQISEAMLNEIDEGFQLWVEEYESEPSFFLLCINHSN